VIRLRAAERPSAMARIALALGGEPAAAVEALIADLGLPRRLAPYGLGEADLAEAVRPLATDRYPADALIAVLRAAM
jgi:hypothetical protein